jgi:hypothetical protein
MEFARDGSFGLYMIDRVENQMVFKLKWVLSDAWPYWFVESKKMESRQPLPTLEGCWRMTLKESAWMGLTDSLGIDPSFILQGQVGEFIWELAGPQTSSDSGIFGPSFWGPIHQLLACSPVRELFFEDHRQPRRDEEESGIILPSSDPHNASWFKATRHVPNPYSEMKMKPGPALGVKTSSKKGRKIETQLGYAA